jgi:hypothetical protein
MRSKLDPVAHSEWHEYYRTAARRRRHAGWHRHSETRKPRKMRLDAANVLAIVMGLATVTVLLCLAFPS